VAWLGPWMLARLLGVGLLLSLVFLDIILLSQHTHMPMSLSEGREVRPFAATEQGGFTRSLRFPSWFSKGVLLHFDAHELHHLYPAVPGYHLRRIPYAAPNEVDWWTWTRRARRMQAERFMFQNRDDTGEDLYAAQNGLSPLPSGEGEGEGSTHPSPTVRMRSAGAPARG
jgi:omega-6 fatty acid desaturase (delta-12 desaturase)